VHPIAADGRISINKKKQPQHEVELEFNSIDISLTDEQYRSLLKAADYFAWLTQRTKYETIVLCLVCV
jgi:hypothetical protein